MSVLEEIHNEEARHADLLRAAIESLGADPTAQTPCADLTGVQSLGLVQAINDPRTTIAQSVHTILIAELADNAGWELLIRLAEDMGHTKIAQQFQEALLAEERHLVTVKGWMEQLTLGEAKVLSTT
jgi:rubrerythrin